MNPGLLISFEGSDGSGKSTQIALLETWLKEQNRPVAVFREPGGSTISEAIRAILLDPGHTAMAADTELLLYTASRMQLLHEKVCPALAEGRVVILDRFADSTTAYQGWGRGLPLERVRQLNELVRSIAWPRRTYWLDLDPATGLARAGSRGAEADRLERERLEFFLAVREGYRRIHAEDPQRVIKLDAGAAVNQIAMRIREDLSLLLPRP
ncbi:MAG: dTMP kinase [Calditrichaeota bacterium]|nr:dTMP kinase [Candidatus Cloacimonadota bacterium]MCA9787943.1 dTMP kinase [Candidatus Cloacimonadota bacterium]MCB1046245.1 dTMP kinase [Calditrichota bacterium]MCB9473558.1 dTMP kinase [Candidatus Delongbacteria bacterium]